MGQTTNTFSNTLPHAGERQSAGRRGPPVSLCEMSLSLKNRCPTVMRAFRIQHDVRWYAVVLLLLGGTCTVASHCAEGQYLITETVSAIVTCSGGCLCQPSTGTISGTISDGPSNYANFANCTWLIASSGLQSLVLVIQYDQSLVLVIHYGKEL